MKQKVPEAPVKMNRIWPWLNSTQQQGTVDRLPKSQRTTTQAASVVYSGFPSPGASSPIEENKYAGTTTRAPNKLLASGWLAGGGSPHETTEVEPTKIRGQCAGLLLTLAKSRQAYLKPWSGGKTHFTNISSKPLLLPGGHNCPSIGLMLDAEEEEQGSRSSSVHNYAAVCENNTDSLHSTLVLLNVSHPLTS